jgi:hypothetical protein
MFSLRYHKFGLTLAVYDTFSKSLNRFRPQDVCWVRRQHAVRSLSLVNQTHACTVLNLVKHSMHSLCRRMAYVYVSCLYLFLIAVNFFACALNNFCGLSQREEHPL